MMIVMLMRWLVVVAEEERNEKKELIVHVFGQSCSKEQKWTESQSRSQA